LCAGDVVSGSGADVGVVGGDAGGCCGVGVS